MASNGACNKRKYPRTPANPAKRRLSSREESKIGNMLSLFRKSRFSPKLYSTYNSIVAQSRTPIFYAEWQVPDTVTGRFDMISLHIAMVLRRLRNDDQATKKYAQTLFDLFFTDMDRNLREAGTGDTVVPKRIKKMGELFYGLLEKLNQAFGKNDADEIQNILHRNILGEEAESFSAQKLADYVQGLEQELAEISLEEIMNGHLNFRALHNETQNGE